MENESCTNIDLVSKAEETLPLIALERFSKVFSIEDYATILRTFGCDKPITFRTNTLQTNEEQILAELQHGGMESKPISWCPLGRQLTTGTVRSLQSLSCSLQGGFYIQAASSMLAAHAMQITSEMRVLDMCAAPGSKTSQLAAIMGNQGMLIANDRSRKRLYRLRDILKTQGVTNVRFYVAKGNGLVNHMLTASTECLLMCLAVAKVGFELINQFGFHNGVCTKSKNCQSFKSNYL